MFGTGVEALVVDATSNFHPLLLFVPWKLILLDRK